jgi:hypothetical protein
MYVYALIDFLKVSSSFGVGVKLDCLGDIVHEDNTWSTVSSEACRDLFPATNDSL